MADRLRTTQRAPRSCVACSTRKVKCDKAIPCSTCIRRGTASSCARETVIVRGEVKVAVDTSRLPSYDQLWRENERLQTELQALRTSSTASSTALSSAQGHRRLKTFDAGEAFEDLLFGRRATELPPRASEKLSWSSIAIPSRQCSEQLIAYDKMWNSWAHYAIEYPQFDEEHEQFLSALQRGVTLEQMDASWLAVYFSALCAALLLVDDNEARRLPLPDRAHSRLCRHWYDAALFCLHEAEFMRRPSIRTVQAVAILGMCFLNFGDCDLYRHMWSCAIRIAQVLGVDDPPSQPPLDAVAPLTPEAQRRLWWTLVICEWMVVPYCPPQMDECDFRLVLPTAHPDEGSVQPVHYHIFMARTATVYYRYQASLRESGDVQSVAAVVRRADEELAEVINTLPAYLQPDDHDAAETTPQLEATYPWIKWQRFDITLVLLHYRLRIHRVLQREWLRAPEKYEWALSVCIRSATAIIWISRHWDQPATMRKQWALAMHLFVAAMLLFRESKAGEQNGSLEFRDDIESAILQLEEVALQNVIASKAAMLLRNLLDGVISLDPQG